MFALGISDFSIGEGVYPARQLLELARRLGYRDLVCWDRGVAGYPKLRGELEWIHEARRLEGLPPDPRWEGFRLHLGSRFTWRGHGYGALPFSDDGYAALNRLLSAQAHEGTSEIPGLGAPEPPRDCVLLADDLAGLDALLREGLYGALLAHPRRAQEARKALAAGLEVVAPQVLRFRTAEGLEMHRLKRAIEAQATLIRTEALWQPAEAAVPRADWESRFPFCEPAVARATAAVLERISGWRIHWGSWEVSKPLGREAEDLETLLRTRVRSGVAEKYARASADLRDRALLRMERELDLITAMGFTRYFLLVQDIVQALRHKGLPTRICGRGSGAASLVGYALDLSNVDPVATNLMFERFLTPERKDPPDMDIDFAWDERDAVIQAVFERYGRDRVAMVANHAFFKAKGALRAVAQAHGRPDSELKQLARYVRGWEGGLPRAAENPAWDTILRQAAALRGHFHQFSVHPGGTVVTPGPFWEHAAFQPAPAKEGVSTTTWDKDGVENYGLVKIDLLGNRSLAVIRDAYAVLGDAVPADPGSHSRGDAATQALLARGDSIGVFYVESPATRQLQQRVRKGDFETLVIHSSLIRPAAYRWVDRYVKRSRGEEAWEPSDPVFNELLSESHGVLVYQEDVIKVCVALAGWSHYDADQLRKLLGKPDCEEKLPYFEARFRGGCAARGVRPSTVDEAWDMIRTFTGYSFCKPHSASYAQVSFESAWIKAHHPAVFFASVITNQGGYYPAIAYLGDARRHRLVVRGPDANASAWAFTAEGEQALRVGLMQVQGALAKEVEALLENREQRGPFADLDDLLGRVKPSVTTAEALCAAGAFDRWAPDGDRTRLMWARLGGVPAGVRPRPTDAFDRADLELATMALTLEIHPAALARVRKGGGPDRVADVGKASPRRHGAHGGITEETTEHPSVISSQSPPCLRGGSFSQTRLRFWALVVADKEVATERGERMQFVTFEDETGLCEAVAFPPVLRRRQRPFRVGEVVSIRGKTTLQDGLAVFEVQ
ncbi:DNA polymerase III subunit alpha [Geothrix fermentans]|uniref:helix-hairpin-helix domain-containing protein n=1 Tax=Geothrix fermentans TaxID=44676 RepID=UPI0006960811|nr:DNA polymerase III subunit alpha [Geothrix fermentans]